MRKLILLLIFLFSILVYSQDTLLINASYIPHTDTTLVYYPAQYNSANRYPLLFMLHGYGGNYSQWSRDANLQHYANADSFIIVCPDGFYDSWYVNSPVNPKSQWETFFFKNLVPEIFHKFNIDTTNIFITGLSMGGHGAMYLFLKYPKFFKSAGSTSGILDLTPFPDNWGISKILGKMNSHPEEWENHSDIYLLKNIKGTGRPIIVDCGLEGFAFNVNKRFVDSCKVYNVKVTFLTSHGKHSHSYWKKSIPKHFEFFHNLLKIKTIKR